MNDMYIIKNGSKHEVLSIDELNDLARKSNRKIHALKVITIERVVAEPVITVRIVKPD